MSGADSPGTDGGGHERERIVRPGAVDAVHSASADPDLDTASADFLIAAAREQAPDGPFLVVCPAGLKLNWEREIAMVEPRASVQVMATEPLGATARGPATAATASTPARR